MMGCSVIPVGGSGGLDTSGFTAEVGDVLAGKTFASNAETEETGTMPDRGTVSTDISAVATEVTIAAGKHSGSGVVKIAAVEQAKLITGNIKAGVTVLGVAGNSNVVDTSSGDIVANEIPKGKKGWADGVEITGTRPQTSAMTNGGSYYITGADNTDLVGAFEFPAITRMVTFSSFRRCVNMTSFTAIITTALTSFDSAFNGCSGLTEIHITGSSANVTSWTSFVYYCSSLVTIDMDMDFTATTAIASAFGGCTALVTVRFVRNTLNISANLANSSLLSNTSLVSIVNGCFEGGAKTLTMHATSKTTMESLKGNVTGGAGTYLFTADAGGGTDLADFLRDTKGWTLA